MSKIYSFKFEMSCDGCANAARKVLSKLGSDVTDVDVNVNEGKIKVTTNLPSSTILETLKKTGKKCELEC
ncbi:hypothetical protein AB6A40_009133 [Gnathostoma spinigerum]|uniref:Copper transport protein ATOX1 n=1 Tax=Gnathostoma spinigerum TaxID=75299 RepID=A0ABD6ER25_9BILA